MDAAERELFDGAIRRAVEAGSGPTLDAALTDLGWHDALAADPRTAISLLFEAQGAGNATSAALDAVLAGALGCDGAAVVLSALRGMHAPGTVQGDRLEVRGLGTATLPGADTVVIATGDTVFTVKPAALELRPLSGIDPSLGLVEVTSELAADEGRRAEVEWARAVTLGQLALGHELVGAARAMLELARRHALDRVQFGRSISSFQAVRHRLAESLVAAETAAALLDAAWDEPSPTTAAMAKGLAGRSARTVARHAQQVLAGIGFTTEHPFHLYLRRTLLLDQLLGAGSVLTRQLGETVLEQGTLPPAFPL